MDKPAPSLIVRTLAVRLTAEQKTRLEEVLAVVPTEARERFQFDMSRELSVWHNSAVIPDGEFERAIIFGWRGVKDA